MQTGICASRKGDGWPGDALSHREVDFSRAQPTSVCSLVNTHSYFASTETQAIEWADTVTPTLFKTELHNAWKLSGEMLSSDLNSAAPHGQQGPCCLQRDPASAPYSSEVPGSLELLKLSLKISWFQQAQTHPLHTLGLWGHWRSASVHSSHLMQTPSRAQHPFCCCIQKPQFVTENFFFFFFVTESTF